MEKSILNYDLMRRYTAICVSHLRIPTENALECAQVLERYLDRGKYQPNDYTRGLYYRGVE